MVNKLIKLLPIMMLLCACDKNNLSLLNNLDIYKLMFKVIYEDGVTIEYLCVDTNGKYYQYHVYNV